ncbi:MAG: sensor histidine kinase [Desulfuromonas sp.]|uniref:sensor histidine kinase n=1 Tax=Desulfuromonas sp. TaxID=892 RepID=UPI000CB99C0E|nr:sensor histidine kinase [Desulfuromonas sp.]PLX86499.1 MAG: sensor histidine kinase [Desulfuromonas sp.]
MRFYRPKSFLILVLLGFVFVSLPLIVALVHAEFSMGTLAKQSAQAVYRSVNATQSGRILVDKILDLERKARQFDVLGDPGLMEDVSAIHREIERTMAHLLAIPLAKSQVKRLEALQAGERRAVETLRNEPRGSERQKASLQSFAELHSLANTAYTESFDLIVREVDATQKATERAQQVLLWQAAALVPLAVLFVSIFTHLISRPIQQIDRAIRRLGEGDFSSPARVAGPRDLEFLGERLDWLGKQLGDLERAKSKFVAQVSHELKTPLASIREGAELLVDEVVGPLNGQQREVTRILNKNSQELQKLIENLLGFSRLGAKIAPLNPVPVELDELVRRVLTDYRLVVRKKSLKLDLDLSPVTVLGDREQLKTVADNLISNAMKYTPPEGRIAIMLGKDGERALLDVTDSGPGIPPEERESVFEPFYQGRSVPSPGHLKGTGLGLSIAREFAFAHGGSLRLMDEGELGAHFRVNLPCRKGEEA